MALQTWVLVALGGSLGAMARYGVALLFPLSKPGFPLATFLVNVVGSFFMGAIFVVVVEKMLVASALRPAVMVGFLGAFTTFSSFSIETLQLLQNGHWQLAIFYVGASVLACLAAAYTGYLMLLKLF